MKFLLLFIIIPILSFIPTDDEKIGWSSQHKISWEDFKGKIDNNYAYAALSYCGINSKMKGHKDSVLFIVESYFAPNLSWVKESQKNEDLLRHEQGHFDINEIAARKLRKALSETLFNRTNVNTLFRNLRSNTFSLLNKEQELYDTETDHSKNIAKQLEWEKKIKTELKELESYSESAFKLHYTN